MTTRGKAGAEKPKKTGKFADADVYAYVWPTKVDPEAAGFEKGSGILAAAVTAHPDFDDEPLFDNNGGEWHFHWVVLAKDAACGGAALKARDIEPGTKPKLPKTWPGAPIFIDSPGYKPRFEATTVRVTAPFESSEVAQSVAFDGVTTVLKINGNLHAPLLCVSDVFKIASGDLSLPGKAVPPSEPITAVALHLRELNAATVAYVAARVREMQEKRRPAAHVPGSLKKAAAMRILFSCWMSAPSSADLPV